MMQYFTGTGRIWS